MNSVFSPSRVVAPFENAKTTTDFGPVVIVPFSGIESFGLSLLTKFPGAVNVASPSTFATPTQPFCIPASRGSVAAG
jgi:hypothetical protein